MNEDEQALGFIEFKPAILVATSDLGASFNATIGGVNLGIELPRLPADKSDLHACLISPTSAENHPEGRRRSWGDIQSASALGPLTASVDCASTTLTRREIEMVSAAHLEWLDRFGAFVRLLTKQGTLSTVLIDRASRPQVSFFATAVPPYRMGPKIKISVNVVGQNHGRPAQVDDLRQASEWASNGKLVPLPYLLLLSACEAFRSGQNRTAVIEATTALEVAITTKIRAHLLTQAPPQHTEWLLEGYDGLTRKLQILAKVFGKGTLSVPSGYPQFRNKVAHGGHDAPLKEAQVHLERTWMMVSKLIPDLACDP